MEAIIFDMDGVIIDSEPIHYHCSNKLLAPFNIELNREKYDTYIGGSCKVMWSDIREEHGLEDSVDTIIANEFKIFLDYLKNGKGQVKPIEGIPELLAQLKDEKATIALASSSSMENINTVTSLFGIDHYFKVKVTGQTLKETKPHPEIFFKTAELLDVEPKKCLVIEDSRNGAVAAKAAGMICIGYQNPNCGYQDLSMADHVVNHISHINMDLIKSLTTF